MKIDLGNNSFELPKGFCPIQFAARGAYDEPQSIAVRHAPGAKVKAAGFSRFFSVAVDEIPEGSTVESGVDWAVHQIAMMNGATSIQVSEHTVKKGSAKRVEFKCKGPNGVPVSMHAVVHVHGIVARTCLMAWLDTPTVSAVMLPIFERTIQSLSDSPEILVSPQ